MGEQKVANLPGIITPHIKIIHMPTVTWDMVTLLFCSKCVTTLIQEVIDNVNATGVSYLVH
jgi:hypothetical protein